MSKDKIKLFQTVNDKENRSLSPDIVSQSTSDNTKSHHEINRLEKLYSEQILNNQHSLQELERLELELLAKEKDLLSQQTKYRRLMEVNKNLNDTLDDELHFYKSKMENFQQLEQEFKNRIKSLEGKVQDYEEISNSKNEEIHNLNLLLEQAYHDLQTKDDESITSLPLNSGSDDDNANINNDVLMFMRDEEDSNDDDNEILQSNEFNDQLLKDESDEEIEFEQSLSANSLANEFTDSIDEKKRLIMKYKFEISSLKNEKRQLYNYINKLLKNRPHPEQNEILKHKLVNRKILRVTSVNNGKIDDVKKQNYNEIILKGKKKRVISNYVDLKSYNNEVFNANSDDENVDEFETNFLGLTDVGHRLFIGGILKQISDFKPTQILTSSVQLTTEDEPIIEMLMEVE